MNEFNAEFPSYSPPIIDEGKPIDITRHARDEGRLNRPRTEDQEPSGVDLLVYNRYQEACNKLRDDAQNRLVELAKAFATAEKIPTSKDIAAYRSSARAESMKVRTMARDSLLIQIREQLQLTDDVRKFKDTNGIDREPHYPVSYGYHYAIVLLIILAESGCNMYFFSKGSELGLLGGLLQSSLVSLVNVSVALVVGRFAYRALHHTKGVLVVAGVLAAILHLCVMVAFNLLTAQYRDLLAVDPSRALELSLSSTLENPFKVSFDSIMLFTLGVAAALLGLYKGYTSDDPYPGYGKIHKRFRAKENEFTETIKSLRAKCYAPIEKFHIACDELLTTAERQIDRLTQVRLAWQKTLANFVTARDMLQAEYVAQRRHYQETNLAVRTSDPPSYFFEYPTLFSEKDLSALEGILSRIEERIAGARGSYSNLVGAVQEVREKREEDLKAEETAFKDFLRELTSEAPQSSAPGDKPETKTAKTQLRRTDSRVE
jgi:hypothetical protein